MTFPSDLFAAIVWLKHPSSKGKTEVKIAHRKRHLRFYQLEKKSGQNRKVRMGALPGDSKIFCFFALGNGAAAMATSVAEAEDRSGTICTPRTLRVTELRNCRPGVE